MWATLRHLFRTPAPAAPTWPGYDAVYGLPRWAVEQWLAENPRFQDEYKVKEWLARNPTLHAEYQARVHGGVSPAPAADLERHDKTSSPAASGDRLSQPSDAPDRPQEI